MPNRGVPVSLHNPRGPTPASRRALHVVAANGEPTQGEKNFGFLTAGRRWIHVTVFVDGGTSAQWRLWVWDATAALWRVYDKIGAGNGWVTVVAADDTNPGIEIVELDGEERVYVEVINLVGAPTGVNVWLSGSGTVDDEWPKS